MARVPSKSSKKLAAIILKFAGVAVGGGAIYLQNDKIDLLALQIDIAASLVKEGHLTPASLALALAKEGLGIAGLSEDHRIKCGVAMVFATKNIQELAEDAAASTVADVGTDGAALVLTTPWLAASGAATLASLYEAYDECEPVVDEGVLSIGQSLDQMDRELTQWAIQSPMSFGR